MSRTVIGGFAVVNANAFESASLKAPLQFDYFDIGEHWRDEPVASFDPGSIGEYQSAVDRFSRGPGIWPRRLLKAEDLLVFGPRCMLLSARHRVLIGGSPLNWHPPHLEADFREFAKQDLGKLKFFDEAVVLPTPGFGVYGHWLLDFFPRLLLIREFLSSVDREIPVLSRPVPKWARKFIEYAGLEGVIKEYDKEVPFQIRHAYLPLVAKDGMVYSSECLRESFAAISANVASDPYEGAGGYSRLLVLRNKPPFASNQEELYELLEPLGFRATFPERLSFDDQVRLFRNADVVVGEDGSAMHGIGFCRPNTHVVIWGRRNRTNLRHLSVARASKVRMALIDSLGCEHAYRINLDGVLNSLER
ncbi:glycosyltransferase family 61 protein [Marinobacter sp. W-8]|uniref:glycosyltransferase family 61 protein n=1 Tax=Marinobacter sp. W-8 TaxID=3369658 RepID=UPI0037C85B9D